MPGRSATHLMSPRFTKFVISCAVSFESSVVELGGKMTMAARALLRVAFTRPEGFNLREERPLFVLDVE
jgi:hypothetical protein